MTAGVFCAAEAAAAVCATIAAQSGAAEVAAELDVVALRSAASLLAGVVLVPVGAAVVFEVELFPFLEMSEASRAIIEVKSRSSLVVVVVVFVDERTGPGTLLAEVFFAVGVAGAPFIPGVVAGAAWARAWTISAAIAVTVGMVVAGAAGAASVGVVGAGRVSAAGVARSSKALSGSVVPAVVFVCGVAVAATSVGASASFVVPLPVVVL